MQAIIMAAGKGSRLGTLTSNRPKSFVEIRGQSLIDINIRMLRNLGIKEIIIVTGYHAEMFEEKYGKERDIHLIYNPFYSLTNVLASFYMGMSLLHEDFIYLHADTICERSILEQLIASPAQISLPVDIGPCDEEAMKVKVETGKVRYISKKLNPKECIGEFIGITKIRAEVLPELAKYTCELLRNEEFSEYFEAAIQELLNGNRFSVKVIDVHGYFWSEIDFLEDLQRTVDLIPKNL